MKDLMRLIEQESYQTSDPITDFLQCLFTNYDFDGAQQALQQCEQVSQVSVYDRLSCSVAGYVALHVHMLCKSSKGCS